MNGKYPRVAHNLSRGISTFTSYSWHALMRDSLQGLVVNSEYEKYVANQTLWMNYIKFYTLQVFKYS